MSRSKRVVGPHALASDKVSTHTIKRAKTDRIDAKAMIRALIAFERGED